MPWSNVRPRVMRMRRAMRHSELDSMLAPCVAASRARGRALTSSSAAELTTHKPHLRCVSWAPALPSLSRQRGTASHITSTSGSDHGPQACTVERALVLGCRSGSSGAEPACAAVVGSEQHWEKGRMRLHWKGPVPCVEIDGACVCA